MSQVEACTRFASALPLVFSKCDEPIYDEPFVAEAYAFVHLLERYRRFSQVLDELLAVGILPMRDRGIDILDVGVGPGPAAFATLDFYQQLAEYAEVHKIVGLHTPPPNLRVVESSLPMVRVMHLISELSGRSGPFHRDLATFNGIDFNEMRATSVEAFISALKPEDITSDTTSRILDWRDEWRFNLGIFSYFLTREAMVEDVGGELTSLFQSMRAGGVVVTLGATAGRKYRRVYKAVGRIAKRELMQRIKRVGAQMPCLYSDMYAARIKTVYQNVWNRLEGRAEGLNKIKSRLPRDLWHPDAPLSGPDGFGLRAFRRINIKPRSRSWQKTRASRLLRTSATVREPAARPGN